TVSGTTGLTGAADSVLVLNRDSQGVTLYGRGRDIDEIATAMSFEGTTGHWSILGNASEVRRSDERKVIGEVIRLSGEPMSPTEIADALGLPPNNVKQLLFKMTKNGEVQKVGRGKYRSSVTPDNHDNPITNGGW